jgi:hypothetical protein
LTAQKSLIREKLEVQELSQQIGKISQPDTLSCLEKYSREVSTAIEKQSFKLEKLKTERVSDIASHIACSLVSKPPEVAWEDDPVVSRRRTRTENIRIRRPSVG